MKNTNALYEYYLRQHNEFLSCLLVMLLGKHRSDFILNGY